MAFIKTYFLCPTSDFIDPPPAGPLRLGSIIRSTSTPHLPLNGANIVPVPNAVPPLVETDWRKTISAKTGFGVGVYAQFLQLVTGGLKLGPEVDVEHSSQTARAFAFDTVTTLSFEPTPQYIEEAVKAPAVQAWLTEPRQRLAPSVSLLIVTGMKLVKGAKIKHSITEGTNITGNAGISIAPLGMTFGPKGHWSSANDDETEFSRASEFVFAFRVKRLKIGRKVKAEQYNKGAFLAIAKDEAKDVPVWIEELDGSEFKTAEIVQDMAENGNVYCVPP